MAEISFRITGGDLGSIGAYLAGNLATHALALAHAGDDERAVVVARASRALADLAGVEFDDADWLENAIAQISPAGPAFGTSER